MKQYTTFNKFSVSIVNNYKITDVLKSIHNKNRISHIIETGTYIGLGSTKAVAEALIKNPPDIFVTLEANWLNWKKAKRNLAKYTFVKPIWGMSINKDEAIQFIKSDEALINHHKYEHVFIDGGSDPKAFYTNEINGEFGVTRFKLVNRLLKIKEKKELQKFYAGENLLRNFLEEYKTNDPLIILDSSGGTGYLEFNIVKRIMDDYSYYLIIDDINHLKHFRSYEEIKNNPDYEIIFLYEEGGWMITRKYASKHLNREN